MLLKFPPGANGNTERCQAWAADLHKLLTVAQQNHDVERSKAPTRAPSFFGPEEPRGIAAVAAAAPRLTGGDASRATRHRRDRGVLRRLGPEKVVRHARAGSSTASGCSAGSSRFRRHNPRPGQPTDMPHVSDLKRRDAVGSFSYSANQQCTYGYMADLADTLTLKLQSMICYHRDANLNYLEIKAMVDELVEENKKYRDEKLEYSDMIDSFVEEKENLEHDYQVFKEKVAPMEEQLETLKKELVVAKEQLAQKNEELEVLRKKLQESEAMHTQLQQQNGSGPGPELVLSKKARREQCMRTRKGSDSSRTQGSRS